MNTPDAGIHQGQCQALLSRLEFHIHKADVRDAQYALVDGLPLFRLDRILEERLAVATTAAKRLRWLQRASDYGVGSYLIEWANLPRQRQQALPDLAELESQLRRCAQSLSQRLLADSAWQSLLKKASVPSEYFAGRRVLGLYPLTNMAMQAGIADWQAETRELYNQPQTDISAYQRWRPQAKAEPLGRIAYDELGLPQVTASQWQTLAARHAPQWMLEQGGDYDMPGRPLAGAGFEAAPVVYWQPSIGKVHGRFLPQISYVIWFSERPAESALDILAGKLDGVIWRVTLSPDSDGQWLPLIYDSIHPCGCYHLFFPTPRLAHCAVDSSREAAFVPQAAPDTPFAIWLQSATHYVRGLKPAPPQLSAKHYRLVALDQLRYRQQDGEASGDKAAEGLYNSRGMVAGSQRLERFLLWTSGLESPGAMRQWGNHATAFSGQRYFDEPALFDNEFCPVNSEP